LGMAKHYPITGARRKRISDFQDIAADDERA
jgi:hypothetical protein